MNNNNQEVRCLIIICLLFTTLVSYAQFPSEIWHEGKIVLVNNDTILGNIKYDLDKDIIQINNKRGTEVYTAKKVLYFNFFDDISNQYRQFYALPFYNTLEYKTPVFFEVLFEGKMTLLAREYIAVRNVSYGISGLSEATYLEQALVYEYFFLDNQGSIVRFYNKKRHLYQILKDKETEIKKFTKRNRLKYDNKSDMIFLMEYYNTLITPKKTRSNE